MLLGLPLLGFSQTKSLDRRYVPIVIQNPDDPLLGIRVRERISETQWSTYRWQAFRYRVANKSWQAVPYQIDERDSQGNYIRQDKWDGVIAPEDELLFMPSALGDKAPHSAWLDNESSRQNPRIEIEFTDPLHPRHKGWIYLFPVNGSIEIAAADTTGYHAYSAGPPSIPAADTAKTAHYLVAHDADGWVNYLVFDLPNALDILDRFKFRLAGDPGFGSWVVSEENLKAKNDPVDYYYGKIRAFHDERTRLKLPFGLSTNEGDYSWHYYPYSLYIGIDDFPLDQNMIAYFNVNRMRLSIDLNDRARGMLFYSHRNQDGVLIDGTPDSPQTDLDPDSQIDWVMATGGMGTVVMMLQSELSNVRKKIYYRDSEAGGTSDGTDDTGDRRSIGDMGVLFQPASGSHFQTSRISFHFLVYFIDKTDMNSAFGDTLTEWVKNPLLYSAEAQSYLPTAISGPPSRPQSFQLHPAYPNPFSPQNERIFLSFSSQFLHKKAKIVIFNILGQPVARLTALQVAGPNRYSAVWNGCDSSGQPLPPGLYLYRAYQNGTSSTTGKIVLY